MWLLCVLIYLQLSFYSIIFLHHCCTTGGRWFLHGVPVLELGLSTWDPRNAGSPGVPTGSGEPAARLPPGVRSGSLSSPGAGKACFILNQVDLY